MRITLTIFVAVFSVASHAQAPDPEQMRKTLEATPINTFRFIGNHLVCKKDDPDPTYVACLRIGRLRVGDSYQSLLVHNPKPWKEVSLAEGVTASVFPIRTPNETKAYWVVGHRADKIVSLQLTGNFSHPELSFATIRLNDPEETVVEMLGPRYSVSEVKQIGGVVWDYAPFPITIELVNRKVYSIKVATPNPALQPTPQSGAVERAR